MLLKSEWCDARLGHDWKLWFETDTYVCQTCCLSIPRREFKESGAPTLDALALKWQLARERAEEMRASNVFGAVDPAAGKDETKFTWWTEMMPPRQQELTYENIEKTMDSITSSRERELNELKEKARRLAKPFTEEPFRTEERTVPGRRRDSRHLWDYKYETVKYVCMNCNAEISERQLASIQQPSQMLNATCPERWYSEALKQWLPARPVPGNCLVDGHDRRPMTPKRFARYRCPECQKIGYCISHDLDELGDCVACGATAEEVAVRRFLGENDAALADLRVARVSAPAVRLESRVTTTRRGSAASSSTDAHRARGKPERSCLRSLPRVRRGFV